MKSTSSNKIRQVVTTIKQIPPSIYHLFLLNIILFIGLVFREFSMLYMIGSLVFVLLLVAFVGKTFKIILIPQQLLTENIKQTVEEIEAKTLSFLKTLNISQLGSSSINTIVTILLAVYISSIVNETLEIFIVFNLIFCSIFLPHETEGVIGMATQNINNVLNKIKYHN